MDVKLEKWFRPQIDKELLKELTKRSDLKGFVHVSIYKHHLIYFLQYSTNTLNFH